MGKIFNVTADCKPNIHYMVDITDKLVEIKKMIDAGHILQLIVLDSMERQQHFVHYIATWKKNIMLFY